MLQRRANLLAWSVVAVHTYKAFPLLLTPLSSHAVPKCSNFPYACVPCSYHAIFLCGAPLDQAPPSPPSPFSIPSIPRYACGLLPCIHTAERSPDEVAEFCTTSGVALPKEAPSPVMEFSEVPSLAPASSLGFVAICPRHRSAHMIRFIFILFVCLASICFALRARWVVW